MAEAARSNGAGTRGGGTCFGVPFQRIGLLNGNQRRRRPSVVRCYALLRCQSQDIAPGGRAPTVSDGVAGGIGGVVVAQALVPDAPNHLAGNVAHLAL